jgi:hypothetical protein
MGNTWRAMLYCFYYLENAGHIDPWAQDDLFTIVSGDDCVIFCDQNDTKNIVDSMRLLTSPVKDYNGHLYGLGQCLKESTVGPASDFSFCSKWFHSPSGCVSDLTYVRDVSKVLRTKQFFTGKNKHLLNNPHIHRDAIYQGFKMEKISMLVEDMLLI